ncbi:hypothetical protein AVEN_82057-1 [Araneus ventricosus]|uniref:Uncharacterized protein n=1 Tax=Araneus ventricosus TaxID=182803 RepID=A0A4Y2AEP9_ARAVE|nr:hypothetical protein AVEN_82057-1 [Araneus ventricosus]
MKSHLRCIKEFQDDCGTDRVVFFETPEIFEATYDTFSEICEEGTLLNTVATENLKCFNETFGKTRCFEESDQFLEPFIKEVRENEELEPKFSYSCLTLSYLLRILNRAEQNGNPKVPSQNYKEDGLKNDK